MAIVQISRITQRKGLTENLPQLAGGELGWAVDTRRLYIGNGTLAEGAPTVGNTEVLTEYSDILDLATAYTYKGDAGGYTVQTGPTPSTPVSRSLQSVLDDHACVKDFGATGDGETDDTSAINRALYQLYCRDVNTQIRRSLFFPAGTYRITSALLIPPFAQLIGEGADSSIIVLDAATADTCVARTTDSLQQIGVNIGNNGAIHPQYVEISGMAFTTEAVTDVFLYEYVNNVSMSSCTFVGPYSVEDITDAPPTDIACVRFSSTPSMVTNHVTFDNCGFFNSSYGFNTDQQVNGVAVTNSDFNTLYQGVVLGTGTVVDGGAVGFRITQNLFDNISAEGILIGQVQKNVSGYNIFLDVGNKQQGSGNPETAIINIQNNNNVSVGDMFDRNDNDNSVHPRIDLNNSQAWALDNGERYKFGSYNREAGGAAYLYIAAVQTNIFSVTTAEVNGSFIMEYRYQDAYSLLTRYGRLTVVAASGSGTLAYNDDYVENGATGLTLIPSMSLDGNSINIDYTAPTSEGNFSYSLSHF